MRSLAATIRTLTRTLLPLVALCMATGCLAEVDDEELANSQDALLDASFVMAGDGEEADPSPWLIEDEISGPDPTPWHGLDEGEEEERVDDGDDAGGPDPTPWRAGGKGDDGEPDPQPWHLADDQGLEADL